VIQPYGLGNDMSQTIINGANIATGSVNAGSINLTGNAQSVVYVLNAANGGSSSTTIDGLSITTNTIGASKIIAGSITAAKLSIGPQFQFISQVTNGLPLNVNSDGSFSRWGSGASPATINPAGNPTGNYLAQENPTDARWFADPTRSYPAAQNVKVYAATFGGVGGSSSSSCGLFFNLANAFATSGGQTGILVFRTGTSLQIYGVTGVNGYTQLGTNYAITPNNTADRILVQYYGNPTTAVGNVTVTAGGSGYTQGTPVTAVGGTGAGFTGYINVAVPDGNYTTGPVVSVEITNGGSYTVLPTSFTTTGGTGFTANTNTALNPRMRVFFNGTEINPSGFTDTFLGTYGGQKGGYSGFLLTDSTVTINSIIMGNQPTQVEDGAITAQMLNSASIFTNQLVIQDVVGGINASSTTINGGNIATGSITANHFASDFITGGFINGQFLNISGLLTVGTMNSALAQSGNSVINTLLGIGNVVTGPSSGVQSLSSAVTNSNVLNNILSNGNVVTGPGTGTQSLASAVTNATVNNAILTTGNVVTAGSSGSVALSGALAGALSSNTGAANSFVATLNAYAGQGVTQISGAGLATGAVAANWLATNNAVIGQTLASYGYVPSASNGGVPSGWCLYSQGYSGTDINGAGTYVNMEIGNGVNIAGFNVGSLMLAKIYAQDNTTGTYYTVYANTSGGNWSWTAPVLGHNLSSLVYKIRINMCGGGAGGGTGAASGYGYGGGAGAAACVELFVMGGTVLSGTVGGGGAGGHNVTTGASGGATTLNVTSYSMTGITIPGTGSSYGLYLTCGGGSGTTGGSVSGLCTANGGAAGVSVLGVAPGGFIRWAVGGAGGGTAGAGGSCNGVPGGNSYAGSGGGGGASGFGPGFNCNSGNGSGGSFNPPGNTASPGAGGGGGVYNYTGGKGSDGFVCIEII